MEIKRDLAKLRLLRVPVPTGATSVRWAGRVKGSLGLGPTDTEVWAVYPMDAAAWAVAQAELGPALGSARYPVPAALQALIGAATLEGQGYAPPSTGPQWHVPWVVWTGEALVLSAHSR